MVQEITPDGIVVYQWKSWEHLSLEEDVICFLEGRHEWTHQNSLNVTAAGDLLVSFRQTSTVGIVGKASGESGQSNSVFRVHRYGPDHPALQGKDLDPARYGNLNRLYADGPRG